MRRCDTADGSHHHIHHIHMIDAAGSLAGLWLRSITGGMTVVWPAANGSRQLIIIRAGCVTLVMLNRAEIDDVVVYI